MKTLYFKESKHADNKISIKLSNEETENKKVVKFNECDYNIIEKITDDTNVIGYVYVSGTEDKEDNTKEKEFGFSIENRIAVRRKKSAFGKIIGYLKISDMDNTYIALEEKSFIGVIILILGLLGLISLLLFNYNTDEKTVVNDKGKGELGIEVPVFEENPTFRMKLNCTPNIHDGKINIRIESPEEDNKELCFTVKVYITDKIDSQGKSIETYSDYMIYESELVYAGENIENGTLAEEVEFGDYLGKAVYEIYDLEGSLLGTTACQLLLASE